MKIIKKKQLVSLPMSKEAIDILYEDVIDDLSPSSNEDIERLRNIIHIFQSEQVGLNDAFQCYIERKAFNAFIDYADKAYCNGGNEATGVILGYYFHVQGAPDRKIIIALDFIPAEGIATPTTCSISYDDVVNYNNICEERKMTQTVWIHSHPGYGTFYSGTDSAMLASVFYAPHQMGVVVDNLKNKVMGFKIIGAEEVYENVVLFDLEESLLKNKLMTQTIYSKPTCGSTPEIDTLHVKGAACIEVKKKDEILEINDRVNLTSIKDTNENKKFEVSNDEKKPFNVSMNPFRVILLFISLLIFCSIFLKIFLCQI